LKVPKHDTRIGQEYIVSDNTIEMIWVSAATVRNYEVIYGDQQYTQDLQRYVLPQLLSTYGQPAQVLLKTFRAAPEGGEIPFRMLLFYPRRGILVEYQGLSERKKGQLRMCPQRTEIALWLWSPEREMTLEDIARKNLGDLTPEEVSGYRSITEATAMSLEKFYQTFKQADNALCLDTPADLWP